MIADVSQACPRLPTVAADTSSLGQAAAACHATAACPLTAQAPARRFEPGWARTITGADEGVYGWIALNYMTGHLAPHPLTAPKSTGTASAGKTAHSSSGMAATAAIAGTAPLQAADLGLATVGALDLGGSSLEVTFALKAGESSQATGGLARMLHSRTMSHTVGVQPSGSAMAASPQMCRQGCCVTTKSQLLGVLGQRACRPWSC